MNKIQKIRVYNNLFYSFLFLLFSLSFSSLQAMDEQPEKQVQKRQRAPDYFEEPQQKKQKFTTVNQDDLMDAFRNVPLEIHERILSFINTLQLLSIQMVSKSWRIVAVKVWQNITTLDVDCQEIGDFGAESLATSNLTALTTLNLMNSQISDHGVESIAMGIFPALTSLYLGDDRGDPSIGDFGAKSLANGNLSSLTTLVLIRTDIETDGAVSLANGNLTALTSLDLSDNKGIGDDGAEALANGNLFALKSLGLGKSYIGNSGAKSLANGNLSSLTMLDLSDNNITDDGAVSLSKGNLFALTWLDLSYNNTNGECYGSKYYAGDDRVIIGEETIGDHGAEALANGNLTALTSLDLSGNGIGDAGAMALKKITQLEVHF